MKTNANKRIKIKNRTEIKKVHSANKGRTKIVIVPKNSDIEIGDFVSIKKIVEVENAKA